MCYVVVLRTHNRQGSGDEDKDAADDGEQDDDGDLENEDLGYVPVEFGALEKGLLPGYLADEITIPGRQRARLFSIMFAKLTDPKARDAVGGGGAAGGGARV